MPTGCSERPNPNWRTRDTPIYPASKALQNYLDVAIRDCALLGEVVEQVRRDHPVSTARHHNNKAASTTASPPMLAVGSPAHLLPTVHVECWRKMHRPRSGAAEQLSQN